MKKNKRVDIMLIVIGSVLILICLLIIWFRIPYSAIKSKFINDYKLISKETMPMNDIMSEDDIITLPKIVQQYMRHCGYLGSPKQSYIRSFYKNVRFVQGIHGKELIIDYTKYNFALEPQSIALIESSMFGIPFQGYDSFINGKGRMEGVFAKVIPVFDQLGIEMDKAGLVTFLSECLLIPSSSLMDYIEWEELDEFKVKATISYYGIVASGIFTFSKEGEMLQFTTNDRAITEGNGKMEYIPWTVECSNYKENEKGYKIPTSLKAIWNYEEGDFIYFDSDNLEITYY